MRRVSVNTQVEMGQLTTLLNQTFQGARYVKAYGMEDYEERRAGGLIERIYRLIDRANRTRSRAGPMMEALGGVAIAMVILYGGHQVIAGARTPGRVLLVHHRAAARLSAGQEPGDLERLAAGGARRRRSGSSRCSTSSRRSATGPGARPLRITGGEVRFEDVRFGYHPGTVALDGISLTVPAGSTVALVGPSGAGKSTLLNLIPRFYDVDGGHIAIDGQEIGSVTLASLRGAIALVSQEVSLFDDTVRANIAYGRFGAPDAEIEAAAAGRRRRPLRPRAAGRLRHAGRASTGCGCRAGSGSASRSPARC